MTLNVRYRDARETGRGASAANGGYGGTVDYDLGYDATGWDTNGFRRPEAGYADSHAARALGPSGRSLGDGDRRLRRRVGRHAGDHAAEVGT